MSIMQLQINPDNWKLIQGYDKTRFVTTIPKAFICKICKEVVKDPRICTRCNGVLCNECLQAYQTQNSVKCPILSCPKPKFAKLPGKHLKSLMSLQMNCKYKNCQEVLEIDLMVKHEEVCPFWVGVCKTCSFRLQRMEYNNHNCIQLLKTDNQELRSQCQNLQDQLKIFQSELEDQYTNEKELKQRVIELESKLIKKKEKITALRNDVDQYQNIIKSFQLKEQSNDQMFSTQINKIINENSFEILKLQQQQQECKQVNQMLDQKLKEFTDQLKIKEIIIKEFESKIKQLESQQFSEKSSDQEHLKISVQMSDQQNQYAKKLKTYEETIQYQNETIEQHENTIENLQKRLGLKAPQTLGDELKFKNKDLGNDFQIVEQHNKQKIPLAKIYQVGIENQQSYTYQISQQMQIINEQKAQIDLLNNQVNILQHYKLKAEKCVQNKDLQLSEEMDQIFQQNNVSRPQKNESLGISPASTQKELDITSLYSIFERGSSNFIMYVFNQNYSLKQKKNTMPLDQNFTFSLQATSIKKEHVNILSGGRFANQNRFTVLIQNENPSAATIKEFRMQYYRYNHRMIDFKEEIYISGGRSFTISNKSIPNYLNKFEKFSYTTEQFTELQQMPRFMCSHAISQLNGFIYSFGGIQRNEEAISLIFQYDQTKNSWSTFYEQLPAKPSSTCSGLFKDQVLIFDTSKDLKKTSVFDGRSLQYHGEMFPSYSATLWFQPRTLDDQMFMYDFNHQLCFYEYKVGRWYVA